MFCVLCDVSNPLNPKQTMEIVRVALEYMRDTFKAIYIEDEEK